MLSIICPVYNEDKNIRNLLDELEKKIHISFELLIIYDTDEATTLKAFEKISKKYSFPIWLIKNKYGRGVLNAIKTDFEETSSSVILVIMADLSDDLCVIDKMYDLITNHGYDIVCGSRYVKGGKQVDSPLIKKTLSRFAGLSLNFLTGISTNNISNSFKMYKKEVMDQIK